MSKQSLHSDFEPQPAASKQLASRTHPLRNITDVEIKRSTSLLKNILEAQTAIPLEGLRFKNVSLHEPPKHLLLHYLDAEAAGTPVASRPFVPRCVEIVWSTRNESIVKESIISLDTGREVSRSGPAKGQHCLLYTSPSPRDGLLSRMPSSA